MKILDIVENWGRKSYGYNPDRDAEDQWNAYQRGEQDFRNRERNAGLEHEDDPNFERNFRQQQIDRDRGPWYLKVNGKIYKSKGVPKVFDWKRGANNYALAIIKNKPELQGKIMLTKRAEDDVTESATAGATNAANIGTVDAPHHSPGKARGKKSYIGDPWGGKSGTKSPPQPKVKQPKKPDGTAVNGLDIKGASLFGGPPQKR